MVPREMKVTLHARSPPPDPLKLSSATPVVLHASAGPPAKRVRPWARSGRVPGLPRALAPHPKGPLNSQAGWVPGLGGAHFGPLGCSGDEGQGGDVVAGEPVIEGCGTSSVLQAAKQALDQGAPSIGNAVDRIGNGPASGGGIAARMRRALSH